MKRASSLLKSLFVIHYKHLCCVVMTSIDYVPDHVKPPYCHFQKCTPAGAREADGTETSGKISSSCIGFQGIIHFIIKRSHQHVENKVHSWVQSGDIMLPQDICKWVVVLWRRRCSKIYFMHLDRLHFSLSQLIVNVPCILLHDLSG
jgi:hypothetical protein